MSPGDDDEGMMDLETYEAMTASEEDQAEEEESATVTQRLREGLPVLSEERRRALKEEARKKIEAHLKARRRQRRLMRGGEGS